LKDVVEAKLYAAGAKIMETAEEDIMEFLVELKSSRLLKQTLWRCWRS